MVKIAVVTSNMGNFDNIKKYSEQGINYDFYRFVDKNFPLRKCAMTPRLQARIPKCFSYQMVPNYDYYIWVDGSLILSNNDSVKWFLDKCQGHDAVFFRHPDRKNIKEEAEFIKKKIQERNYYLTPRYENELIDEELKEIFTEDYDDNLLIASSSFIYKNNEKMRKMLKEWWYHISRYHIVDQLGLPFVIKKSGIKVNILEEHYMKNPYLSYIGHK